MLSFPFCLQHSLVFIPKPPPLKKKSTPRSIPQPVLDLLAPKVNSLLDGLLRLRSASDDEVFEGQTLFLKECDEEIEKVDQKR